MVQIRVVPKEEAQQTRRPQVIGPRRQRSLEFDEYAKSLVENPGEAAAFEEIGEDGQKFVSSLRFALQRAGLTAVVRKMRGRDEVRAWLVEEKSEPEAEAPRRGRRKASS